jgi:hypothetical protein
MAWIGLDLDDTLLKKAPAVDPETGEPMDPSMAPEEGAEEDVPTDGSVEFVTQLMNEGHRLTVFTARFKAMPDSEKQRLKEQIEQELQEKGFPPLEVWTGTHKPEFDFYIGNEAITYDDDWGLVMAQLKYMLTESGLEQPQQDPNETPDEPAGDEA